MSGVEQARIFLSYTHKDENRVKKLYRYLKKAGYNPWIDSEDIFGGNFGSEDWKEAVKKATKEAALFLPCLTRNSINHQGVIQSEIDFALTVWEEKLERDIYLIPVRLENCPIPGKLSRFHGINLFKENGFQRLVNSIEAAFECLDVITSIRYRTVSIANLSVDETKEMLRANNFYDSIANIAGKGIQHIYELTATRGDQIIIDRTTGLTWKQRSSPREITYKGAAKYIAELSERKFANITDWRLPTLEETMSLMEPKPDKDTGFYINPLFDSTQRFTWTADMMSPSTAWAVSFQGGFCTNLEIAAPGSCVRAVRSG